MSKQKKQNLPGGKASNRSQCEYDKGDGLCKERLSDQYLKTL